MFHPAPPPVEGEPPKKNNTSVKVYVVLLPNNIPRVGERNTKVLGVKLTAKAAQALVDTVAGAYIVRTTADKRI